MSDEQMECCGYCTACKIDCHLRRKPYNKAWNYKGLDSSADNLLEDIIDDGYTEHRKKDGKY